MIERSERFNERLAELLPDWVALRRDLHAHPEVAFNEFRTAEQVATRLEALPGMQVRRGVAGTGVVATLGADRDGPCLAFRADMDALPMQDKSGKPYASTMPGVAHACGHDGNVACLIGAASMMAAFPEKLVGPVRFIFQPAEEAGGGAKHMIEDGALADPRPVAIFALHGWPYLPVGTIGVRSGATMASTDSININVQGRGTHAAYPSRGIDPIVAATQIVTMLQSVVTRISDPVEPVVLTIGSFHAGTTRNVIPDNARLEGTLRTLSAQQRALVKPAIQRAVEQTASALGARAEIEILEGYPVVMNDPQLKAYVFHTAVNLLGAKHVADEIPVSMGGEDFAYYQQEIPGCFIRLGIASTQNPSDPIPLHHSTFDYNDDAIETGVTMFCALAESWSRG